MTAPHEAAADSRNRLPLMVGAGVALAVLLFIVTKVLGGGGGGDDFESLPPTAGTGATTPTTAATTGEAAAPAAEAPVETFEVFNTKNPFMPLRTAVTSGSTSAAPTATPTAAPAATPVAVTTPPAAVATVVPVAPASVQVGTTGGQATAPAPTTRVALLDVFVEGERVVANVRVNDTVSKVAAGDTFASNFKVVSLESAERCGRFLFGDDQFRLCKGEEVLK